MHIRLACSECAAQNSGVGTFFLNEIQDNGLYTGHCPKGHKLLIATQTLRHEMLFEIALNALRDNYRREAISSFAASVERYYEFSLRVIARNHSLKSELFDAAWKIIARQSERQLGAYVISWTYRFGESPSVFDNKMSKLRNDVIHNGVLPTRGDTIAFGENAHRIIQDGIRKLRVECLSDVNMILGEHVADIASHMGNLYPRSFQVTTTALNVINDISQGYTSFRDLLARGGILVDNEE